MPNWGSMLTQASSYVGGAYGYARGAASTGFKMGSSKIGVGGMYAATGAGAGAIYGGTIGRDQGQSRLSGAMSGALGGAALGAGGYRYGRPAIKAGRSGFNAAMGSFASGQYRSALRGLGGMGMSAGKQAFSLMRSDAARSSRFIGNGINKGYSKIQGLFPGR
jgi:hypothetical protein